MRRAALFVTLPLALGACPDRDAPRPVSELESPAPENSPLRPLSSRSPATPPSGGAVSKPPPAVPAAEALPPGVPDPAEPGIPDLARLARYVFREMRRHEATCPLSNPFQERLGFALETEVKEGRIVRVGLGAAALERDGERVPLHPTQSAAGLGAFVRCLEPHLKAVEMRPSPADGVYRPEYSYPGHAASR